MCIVMISSYAPVMIELVCYETKACTDDVARYCNWGKEGGRKNHLAQVGYFP